jgi:gamma-glutamylcyclotransferase (GGCT)/AIG2-like uncharacterized protein YtfP
VRGRLLNAGWGSGLGYPALILDPGGPIVDVNVFESSDLPAHWTRLDEFEGDGYRRAVALVQTASGELSAWIYVLAE